ncbi:MAG: hypothetical protein ACREVA_00240 [Burkholderiales bacterium]
MTFGHGQLDFWRDVPDAVGQAVVTRLKLWLGEWYLDLTEGTPWQQAVLGKVREQSAEQAVRRRIARTQGVRQIDGWTFSLDRDTRLVTVSARVTTIYGQILITEVM